MQKTHTVDRASWEQSNFYIVRDPVAFFGFREILRTSANACTPQTRLSSTILRKLTFVVGFAVNLLQNRSDRKCLRVDQIDHEFVSENVSKFTLCLSVKEN
jgi:hypothetical protein